jgi:hypothetical protein
MTHPLLPHVRCIKARDGAYYWTLGRRRTLWSKELRWREDALAHFLGEMTAHEVVAEIRRLEGRP